MSACFVMQQSASVHMMVDSLAYERGGRVVMVNLSKGHALPTLGAAISAIGPAALSRHLADRIAYDFSSFDDLIRDGEAYIAEQFDFLAEESRSGNANGTMFLIGWHRETGLPGSYSMDMWTDDSDRAQQVTENSGFSKAYAESVRGKLIKQPADQINGSPMPSPQLADEAGFRIHNSNDRYVPEIDLLHLMEIARHERIEDAHWVGGKAVLTSISKDGLSQRVVEHWQGDQIGEFVAPDPIDWKAWRAARSVEAAGVNLDGMSRLQRERMEKKARKGTLRAV